MASIFKQPENIQTSPVPRSQCHCVFQKQWWERRTGGTRGLAWKDLGLL